MRCPVCAEADLDVFFELPDVPVLCNLLWPDEASARRAPRGDVALGCCRVCGMIHNVAFDPTLLEYDQGYENSLHFSARFRQYAAELVARLIERHDLRDRDVLEIGSGKGDFLRELCSSGGNRGVGFDTSHEGDDRISGDGWEVRFVGAFYGAEHAGLPADLLCCRHVLEHIERPVEFLREIREVSGRSARPAVFFEVPNALFTLRDLGIWDVIYEHCSYFSEPALARVFREAGFGVSDVYETYGGQFLCLDGASVPGGEDAPLEPVGPLLELTAAFAEHFRRKASHWRSELSRLGASGRRVAAWGAGSKGVTFLNTVDADRIVDCAVDINPRKQGRFLPGTGQIVVGPDALVDRGVDTVIVMNAMYRDEIGGTLREMGLKAELLVL